MLYRYTLFPLEKFLSVLLSVLHGFTGSYLLSLILLSIVVRLITTPLEKLASKSVIKEHDISSVLAPQITQIKEKFKGGERHEAIKRLYTRYSYHPVYAVRSMFGLLVQLPFFIAAFYMISGSTALQGIIVPFIGDLGQQDKLLWGTINLLPFIMTGVNLLALYTNPNFNKKESIQGVCIALLFLILLYSSPAALLIYWSVNQAGSLAKNIIGKFVSKQIVPLPGVNKDGFLIYTIIPACFLSFALLFFNPLLVYFSDPYRLGDLSYDFMAMLFLISICSSYFLIIPKLILGRLYTIIIVWLAVILFSYSYLVKIDYGLFRGNSFGNEALIYSLAEKVILFEVVILFLILVLVATILKLKPMVFTIFFSIVFLVLSFEVGIKATDYFGPLNKSSVIANSASQSTGDLHKIFEFSKNKKNIVLVVLDAGAGYLLPKLFSEDVFDKKFDGFVNYHNTVSAGNFTMSGAAALIGGDKYFASTLNELNNKPIMSHVVDAYNWLTKTLKDNNFKTTIINPMGSYVKCKKIENVEYCGRSWLLDTRSALIDLYDFKPIDLLFDSDTLKYFSIFKILPIALKPRIYKSAGWNASLSGYNQLAIAVNRRYPGYIFIDALKLMSRVEENSDSNKFIHIWNNETIAPFNMDFDCQPLTPGKADFYSKKSRENTTRCVLLSLEKWFSWMKENGVYDNTKIIIASDHGAEDYGENWYKGAVNPILLVKDFDQTGPVRQSAILMQNSDVPSIICSSFGGCQDIKRDPSKHPIKNRVATYVITTHGNKEFAKTSKKFDIKKIYSIQGNVYDDPAFR